MYIYFAMPPLKCCVGGCNATSESHRLFSVPKDDNLRNLWMSFLVPTNPFLIGLTTEQLLRKRVCQKHFDKEQFDEEGRRIRFSYPCLFSSKEIAHGLPLSSEEYHVLDEHYYHQKDNDIDDVAEAETLILIQKAAASAVQWEAPAPYDPVWLASVQQHAPAPSVNETRLWGWGWVYESDVEFWLFTRRNPYDPQELRINDSASLRESNFDFSRKVKVLTHGWLNNGFGPMPESIKEAYLNVSDINIIVVDWGRAAMVNYILASYNVASVGRILTEFLNFLIGEGVSMDDVHLIGHSLGAHVVGIAGAYVKQGPIDTITGLDPALPLFTLGNIDARLDKHDARHVEVIHTCGGYLGFASPLGHIDFYPNGGTRQPGCGFDYRGLCAHNRAHMFFAESIVSSVPFTAVRCEDYDELYEEGFCRGTGEKLIMGGFDIHYGKDGIYYLKTNAERPYAIGDVDPNL